MNVRNISDTALWAAIYRARENERRNALFRDPFARKLAGQRGEQIASALRSQDKYEWAWLLRTVLFDRFIADEIAEGADMIVNLAAGLDARPYRMALPPALQWIEVDLAGLLDYKEEILRGEKPSCALERVRLDLADVEARRNLFQRLAGRARRVVILTEGLLVYLTEAQAGLLAEDLAAPGSFRRWVLDLVSPGIVRMMRRHLGPLLDRAGATLRFAPAEGPEFFSRHGWRPLSVATPLKAAARAKRLPLWLRPFGILPEPPAPRGNRPWSAVCLMVKNLWFVISAIELRLRRTRPGSRRAKSQPLF